MTQSTTTLMTADELLEHHAELGRCELIDGELKKMSPAGADHGWITFNLSMLIGQHVAAHTLGKVYSAETGFLLRRNPDTVREADIPFVRTERLPTGPQPGYFEGAPDLAVEVLSPGDRASEVAEKVDLWLTSGASRVWVVDPRRRTVTVHSDPKHARTLHADETLDGEDLLPGFAVRVGDLF
jgi:Uma2 family endonuclease